MLPAEAKISTLQRRCVDPLSPPAAPLPDGMVAVRIFSLLVPSRTA